jgi:hypothetical protein
MDFKNRQQFLFLIAFMFCYLLNGAVSALPLSDAFPILNNHYEAIGALGVANLRPTNSQLGLTQSETDTLVPTNKRVWQTLAAQIGTGYLYFLRDSNLTPNSLHWLSSLEPQINFYYLTSSSLKGQIYRFSNPNFNDFTFNIPVNSSRLMLDLALTALTYKNLSAFGILGMGEAWTVLGYNESANGGCPESGLSLANNSTLHFAWEVGGGLLYSFNERIGLSIEYLYTDLGRVRLSTTGNAGLITVPILNSGYFRLRSQTGLLGLHIAL